MAIADDIRNALEDAGAEYIEDEGRGGGEYLDPESIDAKALLTTAATALGGTLKARMLSAGWNALSGLGIFSMASGVLAAVGAVYAIAQGLQDDGVEWIDWGIVEGKDGPNNLEDAAQYDRKVLALKPKKAEKVAGFKCWIPLVASYKVIAYGGKKLPKWARYSGSVFSIDGRKIDPTEPVPAGIYYVRYPAFLYTKQGHIIPHPLSYGMAGESWPMPEEWKDTKGGMVLRMKALADRLQNGWLPGGPVEPPEGGGTPPVGGSAAIPPDDRRRKLQNAGKVAAVIAAFIPLLKGGK